MVELPSLHSSVLASLYSLKELVSEAGASQDKVVSTIWQDISNQQSPREAASLGETAAESARGRVEVGDLLLSAYFCVFQEVYSVSSW